MSVFRFAPSPNGFLHLGHAFSALLNDALARAARGRFLLRIEDIDLTRCRPEFEAAIYEDLAWLGLQWETPVRRQSQHFPDYQAARERLSSLLYPCFCSRNDIAAQAAAREETSGTPWPRDPDGAPLYPGTCRELARSEGSRRISVGEAHAWRIDVAAATRSLPGPLAAHRFDPGGGGDMVVADPARWGDVIIARKEVPTSYHLSVVVDDALQGVTHVVRGRDLEAATDIHVLLQALLHVPSPAYHHHRLIADVAGLKLAKSAGSTSLRELRAAGISANDVRRSLGF
jgi:glutamyl-Q tRNA(Asp) synthetase